MKTIIKNLFLIFVTASQLSTVNAHGLYDRCAQTAHNGVALVKKAKTKTAAVGKKTAQFMKDHPIITLWITAGTLLAAELSLKAHQTVRAKIHDTNKKWYTDMVIPQPSNVQQDAKNARRTYDNDRQTIMGFIVSDQFCKEEFNGYCDICTGKNEKLVQLACSDSFCFDCVRTMISTSIQNQSTENCACATCRKKLTFTDIRNVCHNEQMACDIDNLFKYFDSKNHKNAKQCPTPDCPYVFVSQEGQSTFNCPTCLGTYCLTCEVNHQQTISCHTLQRVKRNIANYETNDSERWIDHNTKECPRCHSPIEKNGGCLHMTCRKAECNYQFCWACKGRWGGLFGHGSYFCPWTFTSAN